VNTSTTLNVQYTYDTTTTGSVYSNQLRLQTEIHPNSRAIYYDYGSSATSTAAYAATSTVRELWDTSPSGTALAVYDLNGAGSRLALATYPQPSFGLDYFQGTSGTYAGLDRFGRVIDQFWKGIGSTSDIDRTHYAYDNVGRQIYRQIDTTIYPTDNRDQAYAYDGLSRLMTSQVGTLSGTIISGTPNSEEDWTLNAIGNWPGYTQKVSGTVSLNQARSATAANEISGITASVGSAWATPVYDLAGNMTTVPIPSNLTSAYSATYDAWNRLVSLASGTSTIATYSYDGNNRRIVKAIYVSGALDHKEHAFFNERWQLLEVRKESGGTISANPLQQYVWHPIYLDAPVLRDYDASTSGSPIRYYHCFDATFNISVAATAAGVASERYYYSPYGNLLFLDGSFNPLTTQASQLGNELTYTGQRLDPESGLYSFRNRQLHSQLGLFLQRDILTYADGMNLYEPYFVPGDVDPFGYRRGRGGIGGGRLSPPATPEKCGEAIFWMKFYALAFGLATYDNILLNHYMDGSGKAMILPISAFDAFGTQQDTMAMTIEGIIKSKGECNRTIEGNGTLPGGGISLTLMISSYKLDARYHYQVTKTCICGVCVWRSGSATIDFDASDTTNFDPGKDFGFPGLVMIDDQLILDCKIGKPFKIYGSSARDVSFSEPCAPLFSW
jgi:RHS repeat-associated protein